MFSLPRRFVCAVLLALSPIVVADDAACRQCIITDVAQTCDEECAETIATAAGENPAAETVCYACLAGDIAQTCEKECLGLHLSDTGDGTPESACIQCVAIRGQTCDCAGAFADTGSAVVVDVDKKPGLDDVDIGIVGNNNPDVVVDIDKKPGLDDVDVGIVGNNNPDVVVDIDKKPGLDDVDIGIVGNNNPDIDLDVDKEPGLDHIDADVDHHPDGHIGIVGDENPDSSSKMGPYGFSATTLAVVGIAAVGIFI